MDMKKFWGKTIGDLISAIGLPLTMLLIVTHAIGRAKDLPDCFA
jgi:hypothetical protein